MKHKIFEHDDLFKNISILWILDNFIKFMSSYASTTLQNSFIQINTMQENSQIIKFFIRISQISPLQHLCILTEFRQIFGSQNYFSFIHIFNFWLYYTKICLESLLIHKKYVWPSFIHSFTNILVLFLPYFFSISRINKFVL